MSGEVLTEVEIRGAECVSELRRRVQLATGDSPHKACTLLLEDKVLEDRKPLVYAFVCGDDWEVPEKVAITLVRVQELWAAFGSAGGWVTMCCLSSIGELKGSSARYVLELPVGPDAVTSLAFSPNGLELLTASDDSTAKLWNILSGECLCTMAGHTGGLTGCAFSVQGDRIVTTSKDRTARLWNCQSIQEVFCQHELTGHHAAVWSGAFSPDGATVVTASRDKTAMLWDASTGEFRRRFEGHGGALWCASFSHDGRFIATASSDQTMRLWDFETATHLKSFEGHTNTVTSVCFSHDDRELLTSSRDGSVRMWDPEAGDQKVLLKPFENDVDRESETQLWAAAYSPDGSTVMAAASAGRVALWRNEDGQQEWSSALRLNDRQTCASNFAVLACDLSIN